MNKCNPGSHCPSIYWLFVDHTRAITHPIKLHPRNRLRRKMDVVSLWSFDFAIMAGMKYSPKATIRKARASIRI
jgi:hypothetical protein